MVAIGGLLLALTVGVRATRHHKHHLALHTEWRPDALYLSAWSRGGAPIELDLPGSSLVPVTFEMTAEVSDGCRWRGTERLVPIGAHRYSYRYDETILSCAPGAEPLQKTPRTGCVTVED
jgi:hypothetical protein